MTSASGTPLVDGERLLSLARTLIRTRSDNGGHTESGVVRALHDALADSADEVRIIEPVAGRPNLFARYGACDGTRPTLLLTAATDTVPADGTGWEHPPYEAVLHDGELWGRGAVDMKGAAAAAAEAARAYHGSGRPGPRDVLLAFTADGERGGGAGWQALADSMALPPLEGAVVLAPTGLVPHRRERGVAWVRIDLEGRPAPASCADEGQSAVLAAFGLAEHLPAALGEVYASRTGGGPVTVTLGRIDGGERVNSVPGACRTEWDVRLPPGSPEVTQEALAGVVARYLPPGIRSHVVLTMVSPASETSPSSSLWQAALGTQPTARTADPVYAGPTDARTLRRRFGVPTLVWGPGRQERAHRENERVPVAELRAAAEVYLRLMTRPAA